MTYVPRQIPTKVANPELQRYLEQELLDISRLVNTLEAASSGVGELVDLSDVTSSTPTNRNVLVANGTAWASRALVEADISDLQSYALASHNHSGVYAPVSHTHTESDITDLGSYVDLATNSQVISGLKLFTYATEPAPAAGQSCLSQNFLHIDGKEAIDGNDSWLRLNQNGEFSSGIYTPNNLRSDGRIYLGSVGYLTNASGTCRVQTASGYVDLGPANTSWAHFNTDRANFYFNKGMSINGVPKRYNLGAIPWHASSSYASAAMTFSTASPSGGSSGDIWFKYS